MADGNQLPALPINADSGGSGFTLVRYDAMCRAIDAAYEVDEVKELRDQALAFEVYARQARNFDAELLACKIRLRAERKAGQLDKQREKAQGRRTDLLSQGKEVTQRSPTLKDFGITDKQAHNWRKVAEVPQDQFDAALADPTQKPSTASIIRASNPMPPPVSDEATWLCGRLRDFERDGLLAKTPADVMRTMTPQMLDDVHVLAPQVAAWLNQIGATNDR